MSRQPFGVPTSVLRHTVLKSQPIPNPNPNPTPTPILNPIPTTPTETPATESLQQKTKLQKLEDNLKEVDQELLKSSSQSNIDNLISLHQQKILILEEMFKNERGKITSKMAKLKKDKKSEWETKSLLLQMQERIDSLSKKYEEYKTQEESEIKKLDELKQKQEELEKQKTLQETKPTKIKYNNLAPQFNSPEIKFFFKNDNKSRTDKVKIIDNLNHYLSQINELDKMKPEMIISLLISIETNIKHLTQTDNEELIETINREMENLKYNRKGKVSLKQNNNSRKTSKTTEKKELEKKGKKTVKTDLVKVGMTELSQSTKPQDRYKSKNEESNILSKVENKDTTYHPFVYFYIDTELDLITDLTYFKLEDENNKFIYKPDVKEIVIRFKDRSKKINVLNSLSLKYNNGITLSDKIDEFYKHLINIGWTDDVEYSLSFFNNNFIEKINKKHETKVLPLLSLDLLKSPEGKTAVQNVLDKFTEVYNIFKTTKPNIDLLSRYFVYYIDGLKRMKMIQLYLDTIKHPATTLTLEEPGLLGEATGTNDDDYGEFATQLSTLAYLKLQHNSAKPKDQKTIIAQMRPIIKDIEIKVKKIQTRKTNKKNTKKEIARRTLNKLQQYNRL